MVSHRFRWLGALCALLLPGVAARSQARPTFDGTWQLAGADADAQRTTIVAAAGDGAFKIGDMGSGWGTVLTFTRRAERLVMEYPFFGAYDLMAPLHYEFALDGQEVINEITLGPGITRLRTRAQWRGDSLVITTQQAVPVDVAGTGALAEVRRALVRVGSDSLQIVTTRLGVAGAPSNTVRTVYVRKR
jgi:hypothetical protein